MAVTAAVVVVTTTTTIYGSDKVSKKADVDVKDNKGKTPLHYALCNGIVDLMSVLRAF